MSATRRNLLLAAGVAVVYYIVILFTWALQPLQDSVPIGVSPEGKRVSQTVECNTLFASEAISTPPPTLPPGYEYNRPPCDLVYNDARKLFVFNTLLVIVVAGGVTIVAIKRPGMVAQPSIA